jgi:hypothetical protein
LARYELRVFTPGGALLDVIPAAAFERITYERRLNAVGSFAARFVDGDDPRVAAFQDYAIIDVWRQPPGGSFYRDDTFLRTGVTTAGEQRTVTVAGDHLNYILSGRVIAPGSEAEVSFSDYADAAMKTLVDGWLGTGASAYNQVSDLSVEAAYDVGGVVPVTAKRKTLLSVLEDLAEASGVDFYVTHAGGGALTFTANKPYGSDLRSTVGPPNLVFSLERANMLKPVLRCAGAGADRVHVAGRGSGEDREVLAVNGASWALTRFNKRDAVSDARDVEAGDAAGLQAAGDAYLAGQGRTRELDFEIADIAGSRYGVDWDLGDWVSARYAGATYHYKIAGVSVALGANSETITPQLEELF